MSCPTVEYERGRGRSLPVPGTTSIFLQSRIPKGIFDVVLTSIGSSTKREDRHNGRKCRWQRDSQHQFRYVLAHLTVEIGHSASVSRWGWRREKDFQTSSFRDQAGTSIPRVGNTLRRGNTTMCAPADTVLQRSLFPIQPEIATCSLSRFIQTTLLDCHRLHVCWSLTSILPGMDRGTPARHDSIVAPTTLPLASFITILVGSCHVDTSIKDNCLCMRGTWEIATVR